MTTTVDLPSIQQIAIVLVGFYTTKFLLKRLRSSSSTGEVKIHKADWEEDVVYLYQFHRAPQLPNLSPYCLKVETFLRVNKINYEVVPSWTMRSREGLVPFIELNGVQYADSQLIIAQLVKHFKKGGDEDLRIVQRSMARALDRMVEGSLVVGLSCFKAVDHTAEFLNPKVSGAPFPEFVTNFVSWAYAHNLFKERGSVKGMYKHDKNDIIDIIRRDLEALSGQLGGKQFLFGEKVREADCSAFGSLATCFYLPFDQPMQRMIVHEYPNIREYLERIKITAFPDWNQLITNGKH